MHCYKLLEWETTNSSEGKNGPRKRLRVPRQERGKMALGKGVCGSVSGQPGCTLTAALELHCRKPCL